MEPKRKSLLFIPIDQFFPPGSPTVSFLCLLAVVLSNALLSYTNPALSTSFWIILVGIVVPGVIFLSTLEKTKGPVEARPLFHLPFLVLLILGSVSVFIRLYRLTTLSPWPLVDEGIFGFFATLLEEKWNWQLVHCFAQEPILYTWGQFLFFKLFGNSLFSLWLFPAACSIACVPAGWLAGRRAFGQTTGLLAACWMAFAFWPLYIGRFSVQSILMVLWECLSFGALAACLAPPQGKGNPKPLIGLALLTGTGFYIYLAWPIVAVMIATALFFNPNRSPEERLKAFSFFSLLTLTIASPLAFLFTRDYRGYFGHLWSSGPALDLGSRLLLPLEYVRGLFWGTNHLFFSYGPLWGGLFNPLLAGLFFLGLATLLRSFRKPLSLWLIAALILFSLPAVMTNNFEMMRLTALVPILVAVTAIGTQTLLSGLETKKRRPIFILFLAVSSALDSFHLFEAYPGIQNNYPSFYGPHKTLEFKKAYPFLKYREDHEGPGLILLNFHPDPYDQTLFVATYAFNSAENSHLNPARAKWASILANVHEQPYLKKQFPGGQWIWLSEGLERRDGGLLLETVPITKDNQDLLLRWAQADSSLGELTRLVMELGVDPDQGQMLDVMEKAYPLFQGDRLLESRFWRLMAIHQTAAGKWEEAARDEKKALVHGYPMAHLYNELGCILFMENRITESRRAFEKALRLKPNCTDAALNLQNLLGLKKGT